MNINILGKFIMKSVEQPLYLKLSSIYNKILQLVSAILLIIALFAMWLSSVEKSQDTLSQHFEQTAQQFLQQAVAGAAALLDEAGAKISQQTRLALLQKYLNKMATADFVRDIHLYDESGLLVLTSEHQSYSSASINELFAIDKIQKDNDITTKFQPFISEIRALQLSGYLRVTIEKSQLIANLAKERNDKKVFYLLLLGIAVLIGVLLSKAFRPFSREDYKSKVVKEL